MGDIDQPGWQAAHAGKAREYVAEDQAPARGSDIWLFPSQSRPAHRQPSQRGGDWGSVAAAVICSG
jgi:hypothetical protein